MACLGTLPSVQSRRLFELLEEKQEPFLLDIYLEENGCSDKPARCRSLCWPGNACKRLQRMASNGLSVRLLRCVFSNFMHVKSIRKALKWDKSSERRSLGISRLANDAGNKVDETFSRGNNGVLLLEEPSWKCMEMDESRNHSPVSVLDLHSRKASPAHQSQRIEGASAFNVQLQRKALGIFEELLQMAYTPALDLLTKSQSCAHPPDKLPVQCNQEEADERVFNCHECLRHKMTESAIQNEITPRQRQNVDLSIVGKMTVWEHSKSWRSWKQFQQQERDISCHIEDAIFENVIEETVAEMLGFSCALIPRT